MHLSDRKGFLWYGTMYGLIKYDGYDFTTYRHDPADSTTLSNDDIISIFEDRNNYLWIGTYGGGLNRLDRTNGKFTRYLHKKNNPYRLSDNTVWTILESKDGTLWFGTDRGGLDKFDPQTNQFVLTGKRAIATIYKTQLCMRFARTAAEQYGSALVVAACTHLNRQHNRLFVLHMIQPTLPV